VRLPRLRLAEMLLLVALAALDCWAIDFSQRSHIWRLYLIAMTSLPMVNVLAIGSLLARGRHGGRAERLSGGPIGAPAWRGFRIAGGAGLFVSTLALCLIPYDALDDLFRWLIGPLRGLFKRLDDDPGMIGALIGRTILSAYMSAPQFLLALAGAWIARTYRITLVFERRRRTPAHHIAVTNRRLEPETCP
jgi:hypothetical protein